jgi:hypothetical protein
MARREDGPGPVRPVEAVPDPAVEDPTRARLEDQIGWYGRKSGHNQCRYKLLKLWSLRSPPHCPVVAGVGSPVWVTGGLAAVVVVLEGAQHLYQFQEPRSPTAPPPRPSSTSATCTWPGRVRTRGRTGTAGWPSGLKAWSSRSTPSGPPASSSPLAARKADRARTPLVLLTT